MGALWTQAIATAAVDLVTVAHRFTTSRRTRGPAPVARTLEQPKPASSPCAPEHAAHGARAAASVAVSVREFHGPVVARNANFGNQHAGRDIHNGDVHVAGDFHG